jgi:hypothetical protein
LTDISPVSTPPVTDPGIDLTAWEPIRNVRALPAYPTPFTWSILAPTLSEAYRRTASQLSVPWVDTGTLFCLFEGQPYGRRSMKLDASGDGLGRSGLLAQWDAGSKAAETTLAAAAELAARVGRWYARVRQTHWGQADLLQVMEEIENLGNSVQTAWVLLALALRAAGTRMQQRQQEVWPDAPAAQVADLTGHATPYEEALAQASRGRDGETGTGLLATYGHRGPNELELATPRWAEAAPGDSFVWPPYIEPVWAGLATRQRTAEQTLAGRVGFFKRRGVEADVQFRRRIASLFDTVDDARARWLAGTRIWAVAAAQETVADGRIVQPADIFLLELEEVKQLMTGEWNVTHRESLHELIVERRRARARFA